MDTSKMHLAVEIIVVCKPTYFYRLDKEISITR